jgi:hypothetical protein
MSNPQEYLRNFTSEERDVFDVGHEDFGEWMHFIGSAVRLADDDWLRKMHLYHLNMHKKNRQVMDMIWYDLVVKLEKKIKLGRTNNPWGLTADKDQVAKELIERLKRWCQ